MGRCSSLTHRALRLRPATALTLVAAALCWPLCHAHRPPTDERVFLVHADNLSYDRHGSHPEAQVLTGNVAFRHKGAVMTCDSAHYYEGTNSFEAYGRVHMTQGDTLSLDSRYAFYDGDEQMAYARHDVVLRHRQTVLYTDSLDYDRVYSLGYFFDGGRMTDRDNTLTSDWGQYDTQRREALFCYDVLLVNPRFRLTTDTLYYFTPTAVAHVVGPSVVTSDQSVVHTTHAYYATDSRQAQLYDRSTVVDGSRHITADSLYYDESTGSCQGYGDVVYDDTLRRNALTADYVYYNDSTGYAYATRRAVAMDYSQGDTLYLHGDTIKMLSHAIATDSLWRTVHCYNKVRAYRTDMQAVCDSLVYVSRDSCVTMYRDPIVWYGRRQLLGEVIEVYLNDSTVERAHVNGQALAIEPVDDQGHYNQLSSREMWAYFSHGQPHGGQAIGNVLAIYYPVEERDSSLVGHVYVETDRLHMFMTDGQLSRIWMPQADGTMYPLTQIPTHRRRLPAFVLFDDVRPTGPDDIFRWRAKTAGTELRPVQRTAPPLQVITTDGAAATTDGPPAAATAANAHEP